MDNKYNRCCCPEGETFIFNAELLAWFEIWEQTIFGELIAGIQGGGRWGRSRRLQPFQIGPTRSESFAIFGWSQKPYFAPVQSAIATFTLFYWPEETVINENPSLVARFTAGIANEIRPPYPGYEEVSQWTLLNPAQITIVPNQVSISINITAAFNTLIAAPHDDGIWSIGLRMFTDGSSPLEQGSQAGFQVFYIAGGINLVVIP